MRMTFILMLISFVFWFFVGFTTANFMCDWCIFTITPGTFIS